MEPNYICTLSQLNDCSNNAALLSALIQSLVRRQTRRPRGCICILPYRHTLASIQSRNTSQNPKMHSKNHLLSAHSGHTKQKNNIKLELIIFTIHCVCKSLCQPAVVFRLLLQALYPKCVHIHFQLLVVLQTHFPKAFLTSQFTTGMSSSACFITLRKTYYHSAVNQ